MMSTTRTVRAVALAGVVVASLLAVGPGLAAGATTFDYNSSSQAPADEASVVSGGTYQHTVAVDTNATSGPVQLVVFYNASAGISYQSYDATLDGQDVTMETNVSTVIVDDQEMTRVRFTYRSPSSSGARTLRLTADMSMPDRSMTTDIYTGGAHGPSGTTLPRRETTVTVDRPDLTVTDISTSPSSPSPGDSVTVSSTITNVGSLGASPQAVRLLIDGNQTATNTTSVAGSSNGTVSFDWSPGTSGEYNVTVVSDAMDAVNESNESNNSLTRTISVQRAGGGGGGGGGLGGGSDNDGTSDGTPITDALPNSPGTTVEVDTSATVAAVTFNGTVSGTIQVSNATVSGTEATDIRTAADERFDGSAGIVSTVDISPSVEFGEISEATVELTVPRDDVSEPGNVAVVHLTDDGAEVLDTTVVESGDDSLRVTAETDSFSVFAIVDTGADSSQQIDTQTPSQPDGSTASQPDMPADDRTDTGTAVSTTGGSGPGFGAVLTLVAVLLSVLTLHRRRR